MGGCAPSDLNGGTKVPNLETMYGDARLPHPDMNNFKTEFEKEFF